MTDPAPVPPEPHGLEVLRTYGEGFAGRQAELAALDQAWEEGVRIFVLYAEGGAGKTRVVVKWLTQMSDDGYRGAGRVFVHSFYSQGSDEKRNASSDLFFEQALSYFGHTGPLLTDPTEKGRMLARLIREQRGLLMLDGLEPLQHPPSFDQGHLKDPAIQSLLLALAGGRLGDSAGSTSGLCVVTSRQSVQELQDKTGRAVIQQPLDRLDAEAGSELLRQLGVQGPEGELRQAVEDSRGHAYSLMLLGSYLRNATEDHDIRRRHEIPLLEEDSEHLYHARHLFGAYVKHLGESSPEVAVLRLLGFFDRPAEEQLITLLREATEPESKALTDPLQDISPTGWRRVLRRLEDLRLIDLPASSPPSIDSHPLLREYFAEYLRNRLPEAWRIGHRLLFESLCRTTKYRPPTISTLQPLYQAVAHGCLAGLYQQALQDVYLDRILRGMEYDGFYTMRVLGAAGADLGILAHFFTALWVTLVPGLPQNYQGMLFNEAAIRLRALGRLTEAVQPMRLAGESLTAQGDWKNAAAALKNYCELELARGETSAALAAGEQATTHADRTGIITLKISMRTVLADVLHQIGRRDDSLRLFKTAEAIQASHYPTYPNLGSMSGFQYCDILLSEAERSIWRHLLFNETIRSRVPLEDIVRRARRSLRWTSKESGDQLSIAFDHITMARANLYKRPSDALALQEAITHVDSAVNVLRKMSRINYLPQALLIRSLLRFFSRHEQGCLEDLAQAWDISERGPMPLYQADILLYRARLFRDRAALAEARRLIEKHGYHRRDEELADAEAAAVNWKDKEPSMPTKTFISYSHDSEQHSQRVLALANQLRAQGVDAEIDQYETRPSQGWPRWCEEQLRPENSELVLVVCTETYLKRIENKVSADEGMGVFWEGGIIYSYLYDEKDTERFLPVIFDSKDGAYIPRPLKGATRFVLSKFDFSDSGYSALYRELTHQPTVQKPPLGEVVRMRGGFSLSVEGEDDVNVLPPVEPKRVRSVFPSTAAAPAETDPLEELKTLPAAWFDELVYRFDEHNAVSARPAPQSTRAIDLLNVVRVMEDGLARLREEIRRLKASE